MGGFWKDGWVSGFGWVYGLVGLIWMVDGRRKEGMMDGWMDG